MAGWRISSGTSHRLGPGGEEQPLARSEPRFEARDALLIDAAPDVSESGRMSGNAIYHPPVKRSMTIAGHATSISLEPLFWEMLQAQAARREISVNSLVALIDAERLRSLTPPGLASAVRTWLVGQTEEGGRIASAALRSS